MRNVLGLCLPFLPCGISQRCRSTTKGTLTLPSSELQHVRELFHGAENSAPRAIFSRLAEHLASLQRKAGFSLSISGRSISLVLALALPLNLVIVGVIWGLYSRANDAQRTSLLYAARSIAAGVDAELGKYITLGEALARSPTLLGDNLDAIEADVRRTFPAGGVVVSDANGQQLFNTFVQPGQHLPRRNPVAFAVQRRAFSTRSVVISDLMIGTVTPSLKATSPFAPSPSSRWRATSGAQPIASG